MHHAQHRVGQVAVVAHPAPFGHQAKQFLKVEGIALRALHDPARARLGKLARNVLDHALAPARRERRQIDPLRVARLPNRREAPVDLGSRQGQDHQRLFGQHAQGRVHEVHAGRVAPVQVFQHQQHGMVVALGLQPFEPGHEFLVGHQARVFAGRAQGQQIVVGEGQICHLA